MRMTMLPSHRTSLIIPVRDGERFIVQALRSALCQLAPEDEVLVVDDGSRDGTARMVTNLGDERVTFLTSDGSGISAARNRGISAATGSFIAFLDSDDLW